MKFLSYFRRIADCQEAEEDVSYDGKTILDGAEGEVADIIASYGTRSPDKCHNHCDS
jgi:hypothetical protein